MPIVLTYPYPVTMPDGKLYSRVHADDESIQRDGDNNVIQVYSTIEGAELGIDADKAIAVGVPKNLRPLPDCYYATKKDKLSSYHGSVGVRNGIPYIIDDESSYLAKASRFRYGSGDTGRIQVLPHPLTNDSLSEHYDQFYSFKQIKESDTLPIESPTQKGFIYFNDRCTIVVTSVLAGIAVLSNHHDNGQYTFKAANELHHLAMNVFVGWVKDRGFKRSALTLNLELPE